MNCTLRKLANRRQFIMQGNKIQVGHQLEAQKSQGAQDRRYSWRYG